MIVSGRITAARFTIAVSIACLAGSPLLGQSAPDNAPPLRVGTITMGPPVETTIGRKAPLGYFPILNVSCAPDGQIFLVSGTDLLGVKRDGDSVDITHFHAPATEEGAPIGIDTDKYFVGDSVVAALATARLPRKEATDDPPVFVTKIVLWNRQGAVEKVVPLPEGIVPVALGVYGSGNLLVVGSKGDSAETRLYVITQSGSIDAELPLFSEDFNNRDDAAKMQPLGKTIAGGALAFMQVVAAGDNLLLVPGRTSEPILEVNEHGVVRSTRVQLPGTRILASLISADHGVWTLTTYSGVKTIVKNGETIGSTMVNAGEIFQANPADGSLTMQLSFDSAKGRRLACVNNQTFTAYDQTGDQGHVRFFYGALSR